MTDSLFKSAFRSLANSFFKVLGAILAIIILLIAFSISASSYPERHTSTTSLPIHTWKVKPFSTSTPTILQISINGTIGMHRGTCKEDMAYIVQDLQAIDFQPGILKGILLNINTPGGVADDADAILRMLLEFKKSSKIPVYAYVDGICASGGMMIALAADSITATPPSIIGSVGVITPTAFNVSKILEKLSIETKTLKAGKSKDMLNPCRPWKSTEGQELQSIIDATYERFVSLVAQYRPRLTDEQIRENGANIFIAAKALEEGYIDKITESYSETLQEIAATLDIEQNYQVIELRPEIGFNDILGPHVSSLYKGSVHHYIRTPGDISPELAGKVLHLYHPE